MSTRQGRRRRVYDQRFGPVRVMLTGERLDAQAMLDCGFLDRLAHASIAIVQGGNEPITEHPLLPSEA